MSLAAQAFCVTGVVLLFIYLESRVRALRKKGNVLNVFKNSNIGRRPTPHPATIPAPHVPSRPDNRGTVRSVAKSTPASTARSPTSHEIKPQRETKSGLPRASDKPNIGRRTTSHPATVPVRHPSRPVNREAECSVAHSKTPSVPRSVVTSSTASVPASVPASAPRSATSAEMKECSICVDELPISHFPSRSPMLGCKHKPAICSVCLARYLDERVNSLGIIPCPIPDCRRTLVYDDVRAFASAEAFKRFDTLLLRKELQKEPGFVWCKNPSCTAGQYHTDGPASNIVTCVACGWKSCFIHDIPWHEGITCQQYDKTLRNKTKGEAAMSKYLAQKTKSCPNCHIAIQKNSGCDHMTCRPPGGCGHEFCWSCLASYGDIAREGNHYHRPTCRFYTPPTGNAPRPRRRFLSFFRRTPR